jgi:MFS family permease
MSRIAAIAVTLMFVVNGAVDRRVLAAHPSLRDKPRPRRNADAIMLFCGARQPSSPCRSADDSLTPWRTEITFGCSVPDRGMITIGLAPVFGVAIVGGILIGLGNGAMDVAMNAIGVQVEAARQRPIMSFFHAFWSIGQFVGAGTVLLLAILLGLQGGAIVTPLSILIAVLALVGLGILFKITPKAAVVHHTVDGVKTPIPKAAWILGVMALAFGLSEGTATDWSSLHVTDVAGVDPTTGALGPVTVSAFMVVIRLLGDRLVTRFGRRTVVRFGALFAAIGYLTVTLVSSLPMLIVGWALVGFGVGMIAPQVYAVAGHIGGGRVLAVVVTFGYAAFLLGPAFMGFLVNHVGIHHAMAVPALLCAGIIALASTMPRTDAGLSQR